MRPSSFSSYLHTIAIVALMFALLTMNNSDGNGNGICYAEALEYEEFQPARLVGGVRGRNSDRHLRSGQPQPNTQPRGSSNRQHGHTGDAEYIPSQRKTSYTDPLHNTTHRTQQTRADPIASSKRKGTNYA